MYAAWLWMSEVPFRAVRSCPRHFPTNSDSRQVTALQVKLVLQKLASLNPTPTIALNEASELLQKHLSVGLCR